jgi:uncharacterized membrane protein
MIACVILLAFQKPEKKSTGVDMVKTVAIPAILVHLQLFRYYARPALGK